MVKNVTRLLLNEVPVFSVFAMLRRVKRFTERRFKV